MVGLSYANIIDIMIVILVVGYVVTLAGALLMLVMGEGKWQNLLGTISLVCVCGGLFLIFAIRGGLRD